MEKILPYITDITAIIAVLGFVFSVWKYLDIRDREEKRRNYENFQKVMNKLVSEANPLMKETIVIETIYVVMQLANFKKYSNIIIPVLSNLKENLTIDSCSNKINYQHVMSSINCVLKKLGVTDKIGQIATSEQAPPRNDSSVLCNCSSDCHSEERNEVK